MSAKPGERVGAWLSADAESVQLLGYGVYDGMYERDAVFMGHPIDGEKMQNPRITLDSGEVVWGCECWWGPEEKMMDAIGDRIVINVTLEGVPIAS